MLPVEPPEEQLINFLGWTQGWYNTRIFASDF